MAGKMTLEEQIEHFLRLAEDSGATQAERDLASTQAERLMIKHGIERAMLNPEGQKDEPIVTRFYLVYGSKSSYSFHKMSGLLKIVRGLGLQGFYSDFRNKTDLWSWVHVARMHRDLSAVEETRAFIAVWVVGYESDVADAMQLLESMERQMTVGVRNYWKERGDEVREILWSEYGNDVNYREGEYRAKKDWIDGFGRGAGDRLKQERADAADTIPGAAVVLVDRAAKVKDWMASHIALGKGSVAPRSEGLGRADGYRAGQEAAANRGAESVTGRAIGR